MDLSKQKKMQMNTLHIRKFNDTVQHMNNSGTKAITLTRKEANDLLHDITSLLAKKVEEPASEERIELSVDGSSF